MPTIHQIRHNAEELVKTEPMRSVCLGLIDQVSARVDRHAQGLWTFQVMSDWVGIPPTDSVLRRCVQLLSSGKDVKLFDVHFLLFDPDDADDIGTRVDDGEVADAYRTGYIVHPDTGERIHDFEELLVPYFTLGAEAGKR